MIVVIFGPPGSGKGTQSAFIAQGFGLAHVATGDLLRAEVESGSVLGREVGPIMESGALVPDDLIVRVIEERLRRPDATGGILLDGFPRTVPQAEALDGMLRRRDEKVDVVLCLDVPEQELVDRILSRARDEGRADDTPEAVRRRMQVYADKTAPVIRYYESTGTTVRSVDGVGAVDEVAERVRAAIAGDGVTA